MALKIPKPRSRPSPPPTTKSPKNPKISASPGSINGGRSKTRLDPGPLGGRLLRHEKKEEKAEKISRDEFMQKMFDQALADSSGSSASNLPGRSKLGKVPTKHNDHRQRDKRTEAARKRLGITPDQMRGVPRISHILDKATGGIATAIAALRLTEDEEGIRFLEKYDGISQSDLARVSIEEIAVAANVRVKRLLELFVSSLIEDSDSSGAIIAASYQPRVIQTSAVMATLPYGVEDRKMFLTGTKFLPSAKGPSVYVDNRKLALNNGNRDEDDDTIDDPARQLPPGEEMSVPEVGIHRLQSAEDELKMLHEAFEGGKLLEAPKTMVGASAQTLGHQYKDQEKEKEEVLECVPQSKQEAIVPVV